MKKIILTFIVIFLLILAISNVKVISTTNQPQDPNKPICLSVFMTKAEILKLLGDNYSFTTEKDESGTNYYSTLSYKDLYFGFNHKEETCPQNITPSTIITVSKKYTFSNGFTIGTNSIEALNKCEQLFNSTLNELNNTYFFDIFDYKEFNENKELVNTNFKIRFEYTSDKYFESKDVMDKESAIELIHLFSMSD